MVPKRRGVLLALSVVSCLGCASPHDWRHGLLGELAGAADLELVVIEAGHPSEWSTGRLRSHRALGRVAIREPADRVALVAALDDALRPGDPIARCFTPRHALRGTTEKGEVIEAMVCLECHAVKLYGRGVDQLVALDHGAAFVAATAALEDRRVAADLPIAP